MAGTAARRSRPKVLFTRLMTAARAPFAPRLEQHIDIDEPMRCDLAFVGDEGFDRRGDGFKLFDHCACAFRLPEVSARPQPVAAIHRPIQDAGEFGGQSG